MQLLLRHPYFCTPQHVFLLWRYYDPWGIAKGMVTSSCTWNGQYLLRQATALGNIFFIPIYFAFAFIFVFLTLSQINDLYVIGSVCKRVSKDEALKHVGGYVLALDMTGRDFQVISSSCKKPHSYPNCFYWVCQCSWTLIPPTACRSPSCSLSTATGWNQALGEV